MCSAYEGEVILKEKFGSTTQEKLYVRPPGQSSVVIVNIAKKNDIYSWITRIFLPQGFPESVSKDYLAYQIWDTAQAFCSTITGILATQEVLRGVGVGDKDATPLAATVTWVLKDGCGHIGRILFAFTHGTNLDAYCKKWRMYADILNNAAMCIEIALPMFKAYAIFALCTSTVMKAIVGVAGGATRIAMTQHHATRGNIADVSAKDSAQETAVNLVASFAALIILTTFGNSLTIFMVLMILHVMFNYLAVRAVCLRTLNEPRFLLVIDRYLRQEIIAAPCEINKIEPIVFYQMGPCILDMKLCGFKIKLGKSLNNIFQIGIESELLNRLNDIYRDRSYVLVPLIEKRHMHILIREEATVDDVLCAYFHAVLLAIITCALNEEPLPVYKTQQPRPFAQICETLQSVQWSREEARMHSNRFAYNASVDLLKYLDKIAQKEWPRISTGLHHTGWDLSKHHLVTDQWRIGTSFAVSCHISTEHVIGNPDFLKDIKLQPEYPFDGVLDDLIPREAETDVVSMTIEPTTTSSKQEMAKTPATFVKLETADESAKKEENELGTADDPAKKEDNKLGTADESAKKKENKLETAKESAKKDENQPEIADKSLKKVKN